MKIGKNSSVFFRHKGAKAQSDAKGFSLRLFVPLRLCAFVAKINKKKFLFSYHLSGKPSKY